MEEKRGITTYFTGVVRLIVFIVLVIVLIVFGVRWASNRRAERKAEEVVKTAQESKKENSENKSKESLKTNGSPVESGDVGSKVTQMPSGVSDSSAPLAANQPVPSAGIGDSILLSTAGLSATAYLLVKYRQSSKHLKS